MEPIAITKHTDFTLKTNAAYESALRERDPYTGCLREPGAHLAKPVSSQKSAPRRQKQPRRSNGFSGFVGVVALSAMLFALLAGLAYVKIPDTPNSAAEDENLASASRKSRRPVRSGFQVPALPEAISRGETKPSEENIVQTERHDILVEKAKPGADDSRVTPEEDSKKADETATETADNPGTPVPSEIQREEGEELETKDTYQSLMSEIAKTKSRMRRVEILMQAIALNPSGEEANTMLAFLLMDDPRRRQEALEHAKRAVTVNPGNARAWLVIGYISRLGNNLKESRDAYTKCAAASGPNRIVRECKALLRGLR